MRAVSAVYRTSEPGKHSGEDIRIMKTWHYRRVLAATAGTLILASPGWAQETEAPAQAEPAPAEAVDTGTETELRRETIIVTARRREESLQDVPLALTAFNGKGLEQQGVVDLASLAGKVPGLLSGNSLGGGRSTPTFAIRGQSQQELASIADPSVSLYVNDVVVPRAHGANMAFFDIASVEVAKGPQGTLFGRNTTGGAILVRTNRPINEFEGYVSQEFGNYGHSVTEGMVNMPLGEVGALRIAGQHRQRDGYIDDAITGADINFVEEDAVRGTLLLNPSDNWQTTTTVSYADADNGGTGGIISFSTLPFFQPGLQAQAARDIYTTESGVPMFSKITTFSAENETTVDIGDNFVLKNILAYRNLDVHSLEDLDAVSAMIFPVERIVDQEQFSEELQLQGEIGNLNFIAGGFYFREKASDQALTAGLLTATVTTDPGLIEPGSISEFFPRYSNTWVKPENESYAVFFQGTYAATDRLSLTVGIRQNWDDRAITMLNRTYNPAVSTTDQTCRFTVDADGDPSTSEVLPDIANCVFTDSTSFDELTYNLSAEYKLRDDMLIYLAHRHGYRTGGYSARGNSFATLSDTFEPEFVDDVELGIKADWNIGGAFLRTNLAAYYASYKDQQRILVLGSTPPVTLTANAANSNVHGAEFDFVFRPNEIFEFSGFYAYTKGEFDDYAGPNGEDLSPQNYPRAPENAYSLTGAAYLPVNPERGEMRLALTYSHQDEYDYNDDYAVEMTAAGVPIPAAIAINRAQIIEAQDLLNLRYDWTGVMGSRFDVSAFVNNLTDEEYLGPYMGIQGAYETRVAGAPRMYGVRLRYGF